MHLDGKVCIVTGGTRGIGLAIVKQYLKLGAKVCACGSREETAKKAYEQLIAEGFNQDAFMCEAIDLTSEASLSNMASKVVDKFGKIDVLVNNAGITSHQPMEDLSLDQFMHEMAINTGGVYGTIRAVLPYMKENGGGSIINTSSLVAKYGSVNQVGYVASKYGVNGITVGLARELGKYNIRVNAVAPGVIATDMVAGTDQNAIKYLESQTPLSRVGQVNDMVGAYVYFASEKMSGYVTGSILDVNGGLVL